MIEWILPTNPKNFRTDDAMRALGALEWFQSRSIKNIQIGDVVYLYVSSPVQEIHWKCLVTDTGRMIPQIKGDLPFFNYDVSESTFQGPYIELRPAYEFSLPDLVSFRQLKNNGLKNRLMGPCRVNPQLSAYLAHVEEIQQDEEKQESHLQSLSTAQLLALAKKHSGPSRTKQTTSSSFSRSPYIAQYAKRRANGFCQLCDNPAPFVAANGEPYLESHHVIWLSQGGQDSIENTVALCPNCHRKMHIINGQADVAKLKRICG